jgi:bifunctional non-homologous end joining protein LigD
MAIEEPLNLNLDGRWVQLTHLEKVLYPSSGFSKRNVLNYYRRIAPLLIPHLRGRPITLKRYPDGVDRDYFYEKRRPAHHPSWLPTIWMRGIDFPGIDDLASLLWIVNLASIELHPYLSRLPDLERPTSVVFDLDPGEGAGLRECAAVALKIRARLEAFGLKGLPKTSGMKGVQIHVPLNTAVSFAETKVFARDLAVALSARNPREIVWRMAKDLRRGKVLIDWSQNDAAKTTVAVYSLRAGPEESVSTPLDWPELESVHARGDASGLRFTARAALERAERFGDLFEANLTLKQKLPEVRS